MTDLLDAHGLRTLDAAEFPCSVHSYHSPVVWRTHGHHLIPAAWQRATGITDNRIVPLCPTGHDTLHIALTLRCREQRLPRRLDPDMGPYLDEAYEFFRQHEGLRGVAWT